MWLGLSLALISGCARSGGPPPFPGPGPSAGPGPRISIAQGVTKQQVYIDDNHRLWIYRPENVAGPRPLVLIAPAGSPMMYGMSLNEEDTPEFLPYAIAGCIVVAYDESGPHKQGRRDDVAEIRAFLDSDAGTKYTQNALSYSLTSIPEVDPHRVIAAGHSSAGTIALQAAEADPRIKACVAYAPIVDVPARIQNILPKIEPAVPGFGASIERTTPSAHEKDIHQPLFLFHANDDDTAPVEPIRALASAVPQSKLVEVPNGGHYFSMIHEGVPDAIEWLKGIGMIDK